MLLHFVLFAMALSILCLILAIWKDNIIYSLLSMAFAFPTAAWSWYIEIPTSKFVIENSAAETVENMGTWVTNLQVYNAHGFPYLFYLIGLIAIINFIYLMLVQFKGSVGNEGSVI